MQFKLYQHEDKYVVVKLKCNGIINLCILITEISCCVDTDHVQLDNHLKLPGKSFPLIWTRNDESQIERWVCQCPNQMQ